MRSGAVRLRCGCNISQRSGCVCYPALFVCGAGGEDHAGAHRLSNPERFHAVSWYGAAPWHSAALRHGVRVLRAAPRYEKNTEQTMTEAITPAALYDHYRRVLASSRIELLYLGRKDAETVAAALRAMLADLPRAALTPVGTEVRRSAAAVKERSEAMDVTQGQLTMGFRTGCVAGEPEYAALHLLNDVFGGCITSKLFVHVRERLSLCYYAS